MRYVECCMTFCFERTGVTWPLMIGGVGRQWVCRIADSSSNNRVICVMYCTYKFFCKYTV